MRNRSSHFDFFVQHAHLQASRRCYRVFSPQSPSSMYHYSYTYVLPLLPSFPPIRSDLAIKHPFYIPLPATPSPVYPFLRYPLLTQLPAPPGRITTAPPSPVKKVEAGVEHRFVERPAGSSVCPTMQVIQPPNPTSHYLFPSQALAYSSLSLYFLLVAVLILYIKERT